MEWSETFSVCQQRTSGSLAATTAPPETFNREIGVSLQKCIQTATEMVVQTQHDGLQTFAVECVRVFVELIWTIGHLLPNLSQLHQFSSGILVKSKFIAAF